MDRRVLIGVPISVDYKIDARIARILDYWDTNEDKELFYSPTSFPTLSRDRIVQYAKYRIPHPSHILFLDADVSPRRNTISRLLKADRDIIVGVYRILQNGEIRWSVSRELTYEPMAIDDLPTNEFKATSSRFGVALVKYEVFEKLQWPYWKNVFSPGVIEMGEDIYFCEQARKAGFDIWCDPKVKCGHIKQANLLNLIKEHKQ